MTGYLDTCHATKERAAMTMVLIGLALLACMVGLFWLKNATRKPWLAKLAYSEPVARLTLVGLVLVVLGALSMVAELFG
jgi:hypothetical protein